MFQSCFGRCSLEGLFELSSIAHTRVASLVPCGSLCVGC
jgi:hypothetical protein